MALAYLGSLSIGQCVPLAVTAVGGMTAGFTAALPQLQGKLLGLTNVSVALTVKVPDLSGLIAAAGQVLMQLQGLLSAPPPTPGLQLSAVAALVGQISSQLATIQAQLGVAAGFSALLGTPGIEAYVYDGTAGSFPAAASPEFTSGLRIGGGPTLPIYAVLLVATDGGATVALQKVLVG